MPHIDLVPNDKIDFMQSKNMKFACMGNLCHTTLPFLYCNGPYSKVVEEY